MAKRQRRRRQDRRRQHAERRTRRSLITGAGVTAGAVLGFASPAIADSFVVKQGGDAGDLTCDSTCTLRDAVDDANSNANGSLITFASNLTGTTITLTGSVMSVFYPTYIYGPAADQLTISGNGTHRIFYLNQSTTGGNVAFNGVTLANGTVTGNGGAIFNQNADLFVYDSVLKQNSASGDGGAIYDRGLSNSGKSAVVYHSTLYGNTAGDDGGAIYAAYSFGKVIESTVSGNTATTGSGGGIGSNTGNSNQGGYARDVTISGNDADDFGGGVYTRDFHAYNTIIANDTATSQPDVYAANYFYAGNSLIESPGGLTIHGTSNITGTDPQLFNLDDNGGPTPTLKPASTSPVVDQGYSPRALDQRGLTRHLDNPNVSNDADGADIGSVELTLAEGPHGPPSADAGTDQTVASGAPVSLNGTGSSDPDGDSLSYGWSQTSGPAVTLTGANTATPIFIAPTGPATLTFELQVCDPGPLCDADAVVVNVQAPPGSPTSSAPSGPTGQRAAALKKCKKKRGKARKRCKHKANKLPL
jgi:K319L-like, PKD domain/Chlamydia polymorphic membrane protein (Chlamydia_PMP) repeat